MPWQEPCNLDHVLGAVLRGTWSHWNASANGGSRVACGSTLRRMGCSPVRPGGRRTQLVAQPPAGPPGHCPHAMSAKPSNLECRHSGQHHAVAALPAAA